MKNYLKNLALVIFTFLMTFNVESAKAQDFGADVVSGTMCIVTPSPIVFSSHT